jgi:hypothetical protein
MRNSYSSKKSRRFKGIAVFLAALLTLLSMPLNVMAFEDQSSFDALIGTINMMQDEIDALQQQLQNQARPTATPKPQVYEPNVKLLSPQTIEAKPGDVLDVVITVMNIGTSDANNVLTQLTPDSLLSAAFIDSSNIIARIAEGKSAGMAMTIRVDESIKPGTYGIKLDHSYKTREDQAKSSTDTLYISIPGKAEEEEPEEDITAPNITLTGFSSDAASIKKGETVNITANLENIGDGIARQVQIGIGELDVTNLFLTSNLNDNYAAVMNPGDAKQVAFSFQAAPEAKNGTYAIPLRISYRNEKNVSSDTAVTYYVNISSDTPPVVEVLRPNLQIRELAAPAGIYAVGQNASFSLNLVNSGRGTAERIKVTATPADGASIVPTSSNIQSVATMLPGAQQQFSFSFAATEASKTQSYVVGFKVEYYTVYKEGEEEKEELSTFEQYASMNVDHPEEKEEPTEKPDDGKTSKPRIIVSEYKVDPVIVRAGQEFDLNITFQNASSVKNVENIKVTLEALESTERKGSVFSPVNGSNTIYIDKIQTKEQLPYQLKFYTVSDAEARTYKLQIRFTYQDEDLNDYEETEQIAINVQQATSLEIENIELPDTASVGQNIDIYSSIYNTGRVTVRNIRIRVDTETPDAMDSSSLEGWLGTIGIGNTMNFDGALVPQLAGNQKGDIVFSGEDDAGELVEYKIPFNINVTDDGGMGGGFDGMGGGMIIDGPGGMMVVEPGMPGDPSMIGEDPSINGGEPQGLWGQITSFVTTYLVWVIVGGSALVIIIVVVIVLAVRRSKKRIDFDE